MYKVRIIEGGKVAFESLTPETFPCAGKAGCPNRMKRKYQMCSRCINTMGKWYADGGPTEDEAVALARRVLGFYEMEPELTWWDKNRAGFAFFLLCVISLCILTCAGLGGGWLIGLFA